jgi:hypothetical protein
MTLPVLAAVWLIGFLVTCLAFHRWGGLREHFIFAPVWPVWLLPLVLLLFCELVGGFIESRFDERRNL